MKILKEKQKAKLDIEGELKNQTKLKNSIDYFENNRGKTNQKRLKFKTQN